MISNQGLATVYRRKAALERVAMAAVLPWLALVLFLKFKSTPPLWNELFFLIRDYQGFHLWHPYSAKAVASAAVAFWIIWAVLKCGAQLLGKMLPAAELSSLEKRVFSAGLGFAAISSVTLLLGLLRLWYVSVFWCVLIAEIGRAHV